MDSCGLLACGAVGSANGMGAGGVSIPELSNHQRDLMAMGLCPFCERRVKGWRPPEPGSFAPEAWATLRERGIDGRTGHGERCAYKEIAL